MNLEQMKKADFELLSYKDITDIILKEKGAMSTPDLFKKIIGYLELPESDFESKIGDYYMMLTTDKRFILLDDGKWDLRSRYTSDKIVNITDEEDEIEEEQQKAREEETVEEDDYDVDDNEEDDYDDDLKDLVIMDADEMEFEQ